jgi:sialic acid synthase SpsE
MEIIAEIGQNHNGDMELARELIRSAKANGASVAKFQVFDTDSIFGKENNEWYEYNRKAQLTRDNVLYLARECEKAGMEFMASVFDLERLKWLEEAGVKRYKVASRSINDRELINAIIKTGKPIIISLGHWHKKEFPKINSSAPLYFLYCVSKYPAGLEELKLSTVDFNKYTGFSDHTVGITAALVALSRGARIIEKHFTLDKKMYGPDHACSMTPDELKQIHNFRLELKRCL